MLRGAIWRSSFWYVSDLDGQYPPPPAIGEERSVPFKWSPGQLGQRLAVAKCTVGDRAWFATGIPPEANVPNPPPLPACCRLPVRIALGGFQLGGRVEAVPIVQGGLLAGGEAFRTLLGASGGLMLGGVTAPFGTFVVGGLLIGGEAFPEPLDAEGGLLIGGEAFPEPLDAEGGLLIGGVQETEPAPVGLGGLWFGGEAQEPMALLYCSVRANTPQSIPTNLDTVLTWDTVETDPSGMYTGGSPTRLTVPVDGVYLVQHQLNWGTFALPNEVAGSLRKNGVARQTLYGGMFGASGVIYAGGAAILDLTAGDYLEVSAVQDSGVSASPATSGYLAPSFRVAALAPDPPSGRLLGIQRFTTPGAYTYTPTTGTASVIVELQGAGGGGGGVPSPGGTATAAGGGGGAGSWLRKLLTSNFSGATGTVGTGGTAGSNTGGSGGTGGSTTFVTSGGGPVTYTAGGGGGGGGGFGQPANAAIISGVGAAVTGGDDNAAGAPGQMGITNTNFEVAVGGAGGASRYGGASNNTGVVSNNTSVAGSTPGGFGGGGGGAAAHGTGVGRTGGGGGGGCVVIWEYS